MRAVTQTHKSASRAAAPKASSSTNPAPLTVAQKSREVLADVLPNVAPFNCPVLGLLIEFDELVRIYNAEDHKRKSNDVLMGAISDRLSAIRDEASQLSPASAQGAAFQIMLASSEPGTMVNGSSARIIEEAEQRCERLLYRALDRFGQTATEFKNAREYLMPIRLDPKKKEAR